jgi:hypothetical protein
MRTAPSSTRPEVPAVLAGVVIETTPAETAEVPFGPLTARDAARAALAEAKRLAAVARDAAKAAREAKAAAPKPVTARDYVRKVDAAILGYAAFLVAEEVPEEMRAEVAQLIANQLHHLASPSSGWVGDLPKPDRSEWR